VSISSPHNDWFSKFFRGHILWKICNKMVTTTATNNNTRTMFMVLSSCLKQHCESLPWFKRWVQHGLNHKPACRLPVNSCCFKPLLVAVLRKRNASIKQFIKTQKINFYESARKPLTIAILLLLSPKVYHPTEGRRLSRPSMLATYRDGLSARSTRSPVQVLTGPGVTTLIETNALPLSHATN